MSDYNNFLSMLSTEFHKYLMEKEEIAEKIPQNALIIFKVEGEDEFNSWHKNVSLNNQESNQTVIYISVKKWRSHSSIEELILTTAK